MNRAFSRRLFGGLLLIFLAGSPADAGPTVVPKAFVARIVTAEGGDRFYIELLNGKIKYSSAALGEKPKEEIITPTRSHWRKFRKALDDLNVWRWQEEYSAPFMDGTDWTLHIEYSDKKTSARGFNSYPDSNGKPNEDGYTTETFDRYIVAVRALLGGRDFH